MARMENIDVDTGHDPVEEDQMAFEMWLWLTAGRWAQTFAILGGLLSACAILFYHS